MSSAKKSWIRLLRIWCTLIAIASVIQGTAVIFIATRSWAIYAQMYEYMVLLFLPFASVAAAVATVFKPKFFWFIALISLIWLSIHLYIDITHPTPSRDGAVFGGTLLRRLLNLFIIWMTIRLGRKATSSKWDDDIKSVF